MMEDEYNAVVVLHEGHGGQRSSRQRGGSAFRLKSLVEVFVKKEHGC